VKLQLASLFAGTATLLSLTGCDMDWAGRDKGVPAQENSSETLVNAAPDTSPVREEEQSDSELLSARNPAAVVRRISGWGYRAGEMRESTNGLPLATIGIGNTNSVAVFGDCSGGANCSYMVLTTLLADVRNPPEDWVSRINNYYDLVSVSAGGANGELLVRMPVFLGRDGIAASTLQAAIQQYEVTVREIARSAIEAGLTQQSD
jgi:hypothetical protein